MKTLIILLLLLVVAACSAQRQQPQPQHITEAQLEVREAFWQAKKEAKRKEERETAEREAALEREIAAMRYSAKQERELEAKQAKWRANWRKENVDRERAKVARAKAQKRAKIAKAKKIGGRKYANLILKGKAVIGMNREQVKLAWGNPRDINRTVGSWGVHEQWVYANSYLYFKNGVMTSFQD